MNQNLDNTSDSLEKFIHDHRDIIRKLSDSATKRVDRVPVITPDDEWAENNPEDVERIVQLVAETISRNYVMAIEDAKSLVATHPFSELAKEDS